MQIKFRWVVIVLACCAALASLVSYEGRPLAQLEGLEGMEPPSDVTDIDCTMCHGDFAQQFEYPHQPAFEGLCIACHSPTGELGHGELLTQDRELCLGCHQDKQSHYLSLIHI